MANRLSATLIVRDEAAMLAACLESLEGLADEVIVVDTGSVDATPEIAAWHGARVVRLPWEGDFAAARNEALRHATGRWILYIDADERAHPLGAAERERLLADDSVVAYTVRFRPRTGFTRYLEHRVFRRDARIRFEGLMHETIRPALAQVALEDGLRVAPSPVTVDHLGYDGDLTRKHRRDVPILRARLARTPGHAYSWTHLGHALAALGDGDGARAAWVRAIEAVRARSVREASDSLPYGALIQWDLAHGADRESLVDEARARFPGNHGIAWVHGRALMARGRFAEAIPVFEALTAVDPDGVVDPETAYDVRLFGPWPVACLALCCFRLGRYRESADHHARLEAWLPGDPGHRVRRLLAGARARPGGA